MAEVATRQQATGFEVTGIERVVESERAHTRLSDTMWLWWSANSVVATVALGFISAFFGLGFWGSVLVIVIFTVLGVLPVAFLSTLGPKTGLAQMPLSRFAFGMQGAKLPAFFNMLACIGWSAVNAIIGASFLSTVVTAIPFWLALIILAVITTGVSVYGYFIVHRYERFAWIPMLLLFGYVLFWSAPHFDPAAAPAVALADPLALFAGIATFGGAIFGYAVGWSSYAADYTRRQPVTTPRSKVFTYALLGVAIPCILLEILGVLITTVPKGLGLVFDNNPPGPIFQNALSGSPIAGLVIALLAFSTIANNVPNDYSFALSTQVLGLQVRRWMLTIVGAVIYVVLALVLQTHFESNLAGFLLIIAYWLGAWNAIILIENWLRKGKYPVEDYDKPKKLPVGWAAVVAMVVGLIGAFVGMSQVLYTGPVAKLFSDSFMVKNELSPADVGFPLAILLAAVVYFILRRVELAQTHR
jgi:NCS1 nucleoside transporter family